MDKKLDPAATALFAKWEQDANYTAARQLLRKLLKKKADRRKAGQRVATRKSPEQRNLEKDFEPYLQAQRLALALFFRRCWNKMSRSGSLYAELDKLGDKMQCATFYASADPDYDGRTALHGRVGSKKGGAVERDRQAGAFVRLGL